MNMTVMNVHNVAHAHDNEVFNVDLTLDQDECHFNVDVQNNQGIQCVQCDDKLENILWRDLGQAKKFYRLVLAACEGKSLKLPCEIGDF